MKHILSVLALAFLAVFAAAQPDASKPEDQIRTLEQQWLDAAAVPDLPTLRKMFASDFMGTAFGPKVLSKQDIIPPNGAAANHLPQCKLRNATVRMFGDTAVLMGDARPVDTSEGAFRVTTVFQKQSQGWQIIAIHMSPAQE
jgi:ketosteroid isomerase-like protein